MNHPRALVVGDLLYDLLARTEGSITLGTDTFTTIHASAGGSAANVAAWLATLGVETRFVGRVGDDVFGEFLAAELERAGVVAHLARDPSRPTGKVFVLVDGEGERTMITDRGASENLSPQDLSADLFEPEAHLHLTGYTFSGGTRRETAFAALRLAREAGMTVSVDPSSVPLLEYIGPQRFLAWTGGADLLFPNLEEGRLLSGAGDPEEAARVLAGHYFGVVMKLGAEGAIYAGSDGERTWLSASPARVADTTGAGDALCVGFLAAWLRGEAPREALRLGLETAARAVAQIGGGPERGRGNP